MPTPNSWRLTEPEALADLWCLIRLAPEAHVGVRFLSKSSEMVKELVFLRVKLLRKPNGRRSGNQ
jgi:hypothetical protein